ncbi:MAG: glycoside hydrolase family 3 protein [Rickettsiaceae bacterium]|nr:glycoside hydrolase family 3 protein [Rickettsiaceae bacterium]
MFKQFIFGISGTILTEEEIALFIKHPPVGFILFSRNIESKQQILNLTSTLKNLFSDREVLIFIDQEGGRVTRVKPPIAQANYPAAKYFADIYNYDPIESVKVTYNNYSVLMSELKSLGIDSPNSPNCDILYEYSDNVIGDRSFGSTTNQVIELAKSAIKAIQEEAGIAWIKHIPGHGRAIVDSHLDLPIIDTSEEELCQTDFKVFQELSKLENIWGMTAHIIYKALDPDLPATLSNKVIDYIRTEIGFKGVLVTDDINMYALYKKNNIGIKYKILKELINKIETDDIISNELAAQYQNYFLEKIELADRDKLMDKCKQYLSNIKPEFIVELHKNSNLAFKAGCDIVLHCSGDIEEMRALLEDN